MESGELRLFHEIAVPSSVCGVLLDACARPEAERRPAVMASIRRARNHLAFDDPRVSSPAVRTLIERGLAAFAAVASPEEELAAVHLIDQFREMLTWL